MKGIWIADIFLWLIVAVLAVLSAFFIPVIRGKLGERAVKWILSKLPNDIYSVFNDVIIDGDYGLTQIDHIVVSKYGIFVIETKNMKGKIYGSERGKNWTKYSKGKKVTFKNPTHQNYGHIKAVEKVLGLSDEKCFGIVVLVGSARLMFDAGIDVIYENKLLEKIGYHKAEIIDDERLSYCKYKLGEISGKTKKYRKEHLEQVKAKSGQGNIAEKNRIDTDTNLKCPNCDGTLKIRYGRYGKFYGCSNYPDCRYTRKM